MRIAFLLLTAFAVGCEPIIFMDERVERVDPELHNAVEFFELRADELRDAWEFGEPLSPSAEDLAAYDLVAARLVEQKQRLQEWESVSDSASGVWTLRSLAIHDALSACEGMTSTHRDSPARKKYRAQFTELRDLLSEMQSTVSAMHSAITSSQQDEFTRATYLGRRAEFQIAHQRWQAFRPGH